jgi:hypothetical protein
VKTAEGSFGEQFRIWGDGDDGDFGSDGDVEAWDSSSLAVTSTEGAVPKILAGFKLAMSIGLDFLEIGESSRYDTTIDPGTSQSAFAVPSSASTHTLRHIQLSIDSFRFDCNLLRCLSQRSIW